MRLLGILALLAASFCYAQDNGDFILRIQNVRRDLKDFAPRLFQPAVQQPVSAHER